MTRRSLLKWTGAASGTVVLAACDSTPDALAPTADAARGDATAAPADVPRIDTPDVGSSAVDVVRDQGVDLLTDRGVDAPSDAASDVLEDASFDGGAACTLDAGNVSDYPVGTYRVFLSQHAIVGRDVGGLYAFTSVCTHEGCDVPAPDAGGEIVCPCHGSRFDANGDVTGGPAKSSLLHVPVVIRADGRVCVATTMVESDRSRRTPVT